MVFICAAFTAVSAGVVSIFSLWTSADLPRGFITRQTIKGILFLALAAVSLYGVWRFRTESPQPSSPEPEHAPPSAATNTCLALTFLLAIILFIPNLSTYPWTAPDEMHHFVVARNIAEFGKYASGNPEIGFKVFDTMDSVGAPVLLPVAATLIAFKRNITAGRLVIAIYSLGFLVLIYFFTKPYFGPAQATAAIVLTVTGFGVAYLSRSLYGEIPAFFYLLLSLYLWRMALKKNRFTIAGFATGLAFGLAVLTKSFLIISLWALLGILAFDWLTFKRIKWPHVIGPATGAFLLLGAWWGIQAAYGHDVSGAGATTIAQYSPNLLFGLDHIHRPLQWLTTKPLALVVAALGMALALPRVFRNDYDPPTAVLFAIALLFTFWWIFFTPGQIVRYMWYSSTIGALFGGVFLAHIASLAHGKNTPWPKRIAVAAIVTVALWEGAGRTWVELKNIYLNDNNQYDIQVARHIETLPSGVDIKTTYWPMSLIVDFFTARQVHYANSLPKQLPENVVYITREPENTIQQNLPPTGKRYGHYVVYQNKNTSKIQ